MGFIILLIVLFVFLIGYQLFLELPNKRMIEGMDNNTDTTTTDTTTTVNETTTDSQDLETRVKTLEEEVGQLTQQVSDLVQQQANLATQMVGDTPITVTGTDMSA